MAVWVGCSVLIAIIATLALRSPSDTYTVQAGTVGDSVTPTLPQDIGDFSLLMPDTSPDWQTYPSLLPNSPSTSYGTVSGLYYNSTVQFGINVDAVFAKGDPGHRWVFSANPKTLISTVTSTMRIPDAQPYPTGSAGGLLECGTYGSEPICVWADQSTLGFIDYSDIPRSVDQLAALAVTFRSAIE